MSAPGWRAACRSRRATGASGRTSGAGTRLAWSDTAARTVPVAPSRQTGGSRGHVRTRRRRRRLRLPGTGGGGHRRFAGDRAGRCRTLPGPAAPTWWPADGARSRGIGAPRVDDPTGSRRRGARVVSGSTCATRRRPRLVAYGGRALRTPRRPREQRRRVSPGGRGRRLVAILVVGCRTSTCSLRCTARPRPMRSCRTQEPGGAIVNVSSVRALRPSPGTAAYGAAKAGLLSLTQSLAVEWAPRRSGSMP